LDAEDIKAIMAGKEAPDRTHPVWLPLYLMWLTYSM
jgi:hypothetical protein